jgi:hypothetical protein
MGRLIEQLAPEYGFTVHARIDLNDDFAQATSADVAIEFTVPHTVAANVEKIAALGVPLVVGTTGWLGEMDRVRATIEKHGTALIWSPNFSIGVNVFAKLVREAARLLANEPQYGAWAWEIHHNTKKDAPSGTLIKLVDEMKAGGYERAIDTLESLGANSYMLAFVVEQILARGPQTLLPSPEAVYPWLVALGATSLFSSLGISRRPKPPIEQCLRPVGKIAVGHS